MKTLLISLICIPLAWASEDSILKTVNPAEPEPKCKSDGQFLLHGGNRCKYVRCAYGTQQAADGTSRLYAVESDCPYGTAVSRATYSHHGLNQASLDERRLCTDRVIRHQNGYRLHDPCSVEAPAFHAYHVYPAKYVIPVKTAKVAAPVKEYGHPVQYGSQYGTHPNGQKTPHPPVAYPAPYPAPYPVFPRPYGHVFPVFPAYRTHGGYHGYPGLPAQEEETEDQEEKAEEKQEDEEKAEPEGKQADLPAQVEREPTGGEQGQKSGEQDQRSGEQSQRSGEQESDEEEKEGQRADEGDEQNEVEGEVEKVRQVKKEQEDERSEQDGGDEED